jgi:hypothetical protein
MTTNQEDLYNNILGLTREQLSKSMNLSTELEALLILERKKTSDLQDQLDALRAEGKEKKKD